MKIIKILVFMFAFISCREDSTPPSDGDQGAVPSAGGEAQPGSSGLASDLGAASSSGEEGQVAAVPGSSSGGDGAIGGTSSVSGDQVSSEGGVSSSGDGKWTKWKSLSLSKPATGTDAVVVDGEKYYTLSHHAGFVKTFKIDVAGAKSVELGNGDCLFLKAKDFEKLQIEWGLVVLWTPWYPYCDNSAFQVSGADKSGKTLCGIANHYALLRRMTALVSKKKPLKTSHCKNLEYISN